MENLGIGRGSGCGVTDIGGLGGPEEIREMAGARSGQTG